MKQAIRRASSGGRAGASPDRTGIAIDPYRTIIFPNAVRERRVEAGVASQLALSALVPHLPYIRLSKIERGEVFARIEEILCIAQALRLNDPAELLIDVEAPGFSIKAWAGGRAESRHASREAEEQAMLLAAALRRLRAGQPALTLARLLEEYRLPAVIISRIENAVKPFNRWNAETIGALCALFAVPDRAGLIAQLSGEFASGALAEWLALIPGAQERAARTRDRIAALRTELALIKNSAGQGGARSHLPPLVRHEGAGASGRLLQVLGIPLGDGLIEPFPNPQHVAPPPGTGEDAYALRMCRASLGAAIPAGAVLIVDRARMPAAGGLAVLKEGEGLRVLALSSDKEGRLIGHSSNPEKAIVLDAVAPADLVMVAAVLFP